MEATCCFAAKHSARHIWLSMVAFAEGQAPASWVSGGRAWAFLFVVGGVYLVGQDGFVADS